MRRRWLLPWAVGGAIGCVAAFLVGLVLKPGPVCLITGFALGAGGSLIAAKIAARRELARTLREYIRRYPPG